jgi:hypothetical protein
MNELAKALFERDLNLQEMDELGALLQASPELAMELREHARSFYLGMGLPEPEPGPRRKGWIIGGAAGLALLLGLAYWGGMGGRVTRPDLGGSPEAFDVAPSTTTARPDAASAAGTHALRQAASKDTGDYLSVVVKRSKPGQVGVRILDATGRELRTLFQGRVEAGSLNFKWDGKLKDGSTAAPGSYSIEVNEDGRLRTKRVRLGRAS